MINIGLISLLEPLSFAVLTPLVGTLVRFRAHYNPKGLQLDSEGDLQPYTAVISSFFRMLRRVYRIKGWSGLYHFQSHSLLSIIFDTQLLKLLFLYFELRLGKYGAIIGGLAYYIVDMLVCLPLTILKNRGITTPYFHLRQLLTPTERRRPWILYLTPGLLAARAAHIAYSNLFLSLILPMLSNHGFHSREGVSLIKLVTFFNNVVFPTAILTPLEVIIVRLSIQRNHAVPESNSISQEENGDAEEAAEYRGTDEDVINLRTDRDPYVGLVDCAKRIIREEGWSTLYRAWWLTLGLTLGGSILIKFPIPYTR